MKKVFTLFTKTLLVAVCLLGGASSAWADDVYECYHNGSSVVNTNDYFSSENPFMNSGYNSNMEITFTNNNGDLITSKKFTKLTNAKGVNFTVTAGHTASVFVVAVTKSSTTGNGIKLKKYNGESWEDVTAYTSAPETTFTRYETSFSDLTPGTYRMERNSQENAAVYVKVVEKALDGKDVVEVGKYEWATLVSTNNLDFTGSAVKAYIVTGNSGSAITTIQVNKVAAGTPVLLNAAKGSYIIPTSFAGSADATTGNLLVAGTGADVDAGSGVTRYVLSTDGSTAVFKKINATAATVAAGKAYLEFTGDVPAPMLSMGGETTGINAIDNGQLTIDNYYNLAGQRVAQPTKGLYIVNGKKVVIK